MILTLIVQLKYLWNSKRKTSQGHLIIGRTLYHESTFRINESIFNNITVKKSTKLEKSTIMHCIKYFENRRLPFSVS